MRVLRVNEGALERRFLAILFLSWVLLVGSRGSKAGRRRDALCLSASTMLTAGQLHNEYAGLGKNISTLATAHQSGKNKPL